MFNSVALDVVIGLVFIFLLYSLLATIIQELIATNLAFRAKILEKAIARMLDDGVGDKNPVADRITGFKQLLFRTDFLKDKKFATAFYSHPLMKYIAEDKWHSKPSYLEASGFSKIVIDLLHGIDKDNFQGINILKIKESLDAGDLVLKDLPSTVLKPGERDPGTGIINPETKKFLQSLLSESQGDLDRFKKSIENWFDSTMERATGWYKKYIQVTLLWIGFIIAVIFNVDTIAIVGKLSRDPKLREQLVQSANAYVQNNPAPVAGTMPQPTDPDLMEKRKALLARADSLLNKDISNVSSTVSLGWDDGFFHFKKNGQTPGKAFFGWLLTALALSLGAPFWFDLLSKLVKIRGSGTKVDSSTGTRVSVQPVINVSTNNAGEEAVG